MDPEGQEVFAPLTLEIPHCNMCFVCKFSFVQAGGTGQPEGLNVPLYTAGSLLDVSFMTFCLCAVGRIRRGVHARDARRPRGVLLAGPRASGSVRLRYVQKTLAPPCHFRFFQDPE